MRWLRGLLGTVRARLFGLSDPLPVGPLAISQCLHPQKAWTACTYQLGPYGYYGWFMRCRMCLRWFAC